MYSLQSARELKRISLQANSPKKAFYVLILDRVPGGYQVRKESGGNGCVFHRSAWFKKTLNEAECLFSKIVSEKTNPARKSRRVYWSMGQMLLSGGIQASQQQQLF